MNKLKLISDLTRALPTLIDSISKDVKALGSHATFEQDEEPSICLTVATDGNEWSYQTGDNSFMGSAYLFPHWTVEHITTDSEPYETSMGIIRELMELLLCEEQFDAEIADS